MSLSSIVIRFDKSHLASIGQRLYSQSFDLMRELIANAYDADAKKVTIEANDKKLQPSYIPGERFKIYESTPHGVIKGEIILSSLMLPKEQIGVGIRVKDILIRRETRHHTLFL